MCELLAEQALLGLYCTLKLLLEVPSFWHTRELASVCGHKGTKQPSFCSQQLSTALLGCINTGSYRISRWCLTEARAIE